ncbi:TPA: phage virion morphogenesis protein [Yersinia enterocolitica]
MGIQVEVFGTEKLAQLQQAVERLADSGLRGELLESLGAIVETQTRRRITDEKESPSGTAWQDWSDGYAKTRHGNQSLLQGDGNLDDSITYVVERNQVRVGTPLEYARVHQEGFNGSVSVGSHQRLIKQAFGRVLKHPVWQTVGAHSRMMSIAQREFLGLSSSNSKELLHVIGDFWKEVLP